MTDYLSAEGLIIARLRDAVPDLRLVRGISDMGDVEEASRQTPAAFVVYDGDRVGDYAGRGSAQIVFQRWIVVLAIRNAAGGGGNTDARAEAGALLSQVLVALGGWQPSADHRPLVRIQAPRPAYTPAFAYFPVAYETPITVLAAPT